MPFLGRTPGAEPRSTVFKQDVTPDGTSTDYTLDHASTANGLAVFVNNVRQEPGDAYTVSGTTLSFTAAPDSADNIYIVFQSPVLASREVVVGADTVNTASIQDGAITAAKLATSVDTHDSAAVQAQIDSAAVTLTGNQTISGIKTFSDSAQFNTHVHISGPLGGNGQDGIYDAALSLTASNQTTLSVMNDSDGFANLNLGSVDPLGDGSSKSNFWHISYRNLSSHSNKLQNFWYDSSGFAGPFTTLTTDGDFGIGVADPAAKLHVNGSFRQTGATAPFEWTVNPGASDYLKLNAVGYADNLIVANSSGNVGIGTSAPSGKLHVDNTAATHNLAIFNNQNASYNTDILINHSSATGNFIVSRRNNGEAWMYQSAAHPIAFYTNNTERMRIDASGRVTKPNQPSFHAHGSTNQQTAASSGSTLFTFPSTRHNIGGHYSTSNSRFTAPINGRYLFAFMARCDGTDVDYFRAFIRINGSASYTVGHQIKDLGNNWDPRYYSFTGSTIFNLAANDYVEIVISSNSDSYTHRNGESSFYGHLLG